MSTRSWRTFLAALAALVWGAAPLAAQQLPLPSPRLALDPPNTIVTDRPLPIAAERYVLVHLVENRLYLMEGERALWSAPVATGREFRLESAGRSWKFATPGGIFRVQRKEKNPVWIKPDWAFVEEGQPIPPLDSPLRRKEGMLGTTAIYIGYELALHGTDRPELVLQSNPEERKVSHGCIRLTNEDARTLYYWVEVGTPILIY